MTHTALARKYRPKRFADLIAQRHVAQALAGAVLRDRVAHGYLFAGPRGVGKTTAARILAMALNCEARGRDGEPCGGCESCARIWSGATSLDVVEIDAASNRGVDDARDLRERAMYAASAPGRSKVYIVDEAHMLTREAWNALLKILEEPPPGVVFVFATTEPQKIAQAAAPVLSRLQRFDFRRIGPQAVADRLRAVAGAEGIEADADALALIATTADGALRDGLSVLDQVVSLGEGHVTATHVRDALGLVPEELYGELLRIVVERDPKSVFPLVDRVIEAGADLAGFAEGAADVVRALLMAQHGAEPPVGSEAVRTLVSAYRDRVSAEDLLRLLDLLVEAAPALRRGPTRLALETLLLKWAMLDRVVALADVLASLPGGSAGRSGRGEPSGRPADGEQREAESRKGAFTQEHLRAVWPELLSRAREASRFLGQALEGTEPAGAEAPVVAVRVPDDDPMRLEAIARRREALERLVAEYVDGPVRIKVVTPGDALPGGGAASRPARLTETEGKAERLKSLRAKDPALDRAAEALDLDLVE